MAEFPSSTGCALTLGATWEAINKSWPDLPLRAILPPLSGCLPLTLPRMPPRFESKPKEHYIYRLDKLLFPNNPIRDYIQGKIEEIEKRYAERIKVLDEAYMR